MESSSDTDQQIKDAMSFKKEAYRNEIRKRTIQQTIQSKRINLSLGAFTTFSGVKNFDLNSTSISSSYNPMIPMDSIPFPNNSNKNSSSSLQTEVTLLTYIEVVNSICSTTENLCDHPDQSDRVLRCLNIIRAHMITLISESDELKQAQGFDEFIRLGGCPCLLQFLQLKYFDLPAIQLSAIVTIGNIYTVSEKPILSFFLQHSISYYAVTLLNHITQSLFVLSKEQQATSQEVHLEEHQSNTMMEFGLDQQQPQVNLNHNIRQNQQQKNQEQQFLVLSELTRTLANLAGESYEYRTDLVQRGLLDYLESDFLLQLIEQGIPVGFAEQLLFLVKNMTSIRSTISEENKERLIRVLVRLFLLPNLPVQAVQDGIIAVKSFAMYGNTIIRAKMISNREVFERMIELADIRECTDYTVMYFAMQTLKDFMMHSERQAQYLFNLKESFLLESIVAIVTQVAANNVIVDLQTIALEILLTYIQFESDEHFIEIFSGSEQLVQEIVHIASYHQQLKMKQVACAFVIEAVKKSNDYQLELLIQMDALNVLVSLIRGEEEASLKLKALIAIRQILEREKESDRHQQEENNHEEVENIFEKRSLKVTFESALQFSGILNWIVTDENVHPALFDVAEDILSTHFAS